MIIDKLKDFYTDYDREKLAEIRKELDAMDSQFADLAEQDFEAFEEKVSVLVSKENKILGTVAERYKDKKGDAGIIADALEIIESVTKRDYLRWQKRLSNSINPTEPDAEKNKGNLSIETSRSLKKWASYCIENCVSFIMAQTKEQLNLLNNPEALQKIRDAATKKAASFELPHLTDAPMQVSEFLDVVAKKTRQIDYPLDKVNSSVWNLLQTADDGQLSFDIVTSKKNARNEVAILFAIDFDELKNNADFAAIVKRLTPFDKRVYVACAALFNAGNNIISDTQIYSLMGYSGRPTGKTLAKVHASITKMMVAHIVINPEGETVSGMKYDAIPYDGALLPSERRTAFINGNPCAAAIHLFREPPMITFARQMKQITRFPRKLLETPLNKSDENIRIEDYLIERISHMKNDKDAGREKKTRYQKILYSTICEECQITARKQQQRLSGKLERLLMFWRQEKFIKGYKLLQDGIKITL